MGKLKEDLLTKIEKARVNSIIDDHEEELKKHGLDFGDILLLNIYGDHYVNNGYKLININIQEVIDEYKYKSTTLWKILNK